MQPPAHLFLVPFINAEWVADCCGVSPVSKAKSDNVSTKMLQIIHLWRSADHTLCRVKSFHFLCLTFSGYLVHCIVCYCSMWFYIILTLCMKYPRMIVIKWLKELAFLVFFQHSQVICAWVSADMIFLHNGIASDVRLHLWMLPNRLTSLSLLQHVWRSLDPLSHNVGFWGTTRSLGNLICVECLLFILYLCMHLQ